MNDPGDEVARNALEASFLRCPFHEFLGLEFRQLERGSVTVRMPFRDEVISNPDIPYIHGGVISALLDIAGDYALATCLGRGVPTIDLRVDYLKAAGREDLVAHATVVKLGRSLGVADAEVYSDNADKTRIAIGRILYSTRQ